MKHKAWQSTGNAVFLLKTHFVWSTKYRKPVLIPPIDKRIQEFLQQLCKAVGIEVIRSEVMPDHGTASCQIFAAAHLVVHQGSSQAIR